MSKVKLLLDVIDDLKSLTSSLECLAQAMASGDTMGSEPLTGNKRSVELQTPQTEPVKLKITHEQLRELAVKLSRSGKREEVKQLIGKYGVKNITTVADADIDAFYADLQQMEGE